MHIIICERKFYRKYTWHAVVTFFVLLKSYSPNDALTTGTVVKAANRTVTKDSSAAARRCGEVSGCSGGGVPNTPRSSIVSTPSRRVRPKFR